MFNKSFYKLTALAGLFIFLPATAMAGTFSINEVAEAKNIIIDTGRNEQPGTVSVSGCTACPLSLKIDANTRFFHKQEPIRRQQLRSLSGKSGTVIYKLEEQRAIKVLFW